ncbi:fungal-specific transcription factor domain-containing protein [Dactylonectria estremocensis]|uniref:Fungal-specific transcription factor domain-containing protein n=1 Tax=Dactylonectria estremocensis TaxID=1079267 RepID=A0A9P9EXP7_9HYPO|nr:fungal-specific transcription factor domain-containing protein [Dactylonectria estremocensis]
MSGSRTKTGCWTCRLRRKKCDENIPTCSSCASRRLHCYGYGEKPGWMLDKENWQQVLDSDEARAIRNAAERAYNRRRQNNLCAAPGILIQDLKDLDQPPQSLRLDRTWSSCIQTLRDCEYNINYQSVQTFLDVIFPLQWGFFDLHRDQPGRRWLFDTIVASEPMYHATSGLCITFEEGLKAGATNGRCEVTTEVRACRIRAMAGLQSCLAEMGQKRLHISSLPKAINAVAVILLLASLEIYGETEGAWEVHQSAAGTVLDLINTQLATSGRTGGGVEQLLANQTLSFETQALEFFVTTYVWTDIFAEAALGPSYSKPKKFNYLPLLQRGFIDTRDIMGCSSSIMIAIKEVSIFAACMRMGQQPEPAESAKALTLGIQHLTQEADSSFFSSAIGTERDSSWVTLLHAHAALLYLQTVMAHESLTSHLDIHQTVTVCLELLEALPPWLLIRVCLPFTIAGCMSSEDDHARFRAVVQRVEESGCVLGFTWKGLIVMEECWRLRRCKPESLWWWQTTMEHMNVRILFI